MLTIRTKVKKSKIHGLGIFSDENIPKGKVICTDSDDVVLEKKVVDSLPKDSPAKTLFSVYGYLGKDKKYHLSNGNEIFFNESKTPNCKSYLHKGVLITHAIEDIKKGEELTSRYSDFEIKN